MVWVTGSYLHEGGVELPREDSPVAQLFASVLEHGFEDRFERVGLFAEGLHELVLELEVLVDERVLAELEDGADAFDEVRGEVGLGLDFDAVAGAVAEVEVCSGFVEHVVDVLHVAVEAAQQEEQQQVGHGVLGEPKLRRRRRRGKLSCSCARCFGPAQASRQKSRSQRGRLRWRR